MFLGHFAVALAAKRAAPKISLGVLVLGAQWADTLWPVLLLTGTEKVRIDPGNTPVTPLDFVSYPYSHSLVALMGWGLLFGLAGFAWTRQVTSASILAGLVVSHWLLDWISHRPDMPIALNGENRVGLGLWYSLPATVAVEVVLFGVGLWIYLSGTQARDLVGRWGFIALASLLGLIYVMNLASPPPPGVEAIASAGLAGAVLLFLWAHWADRHRDPLVKPIAVLDAER